VLQVPTVVKELHLNFTLLKILFLYL